MKKIKLTMLLALGFLLAGTQFATAQEDKKKVKTTKTVIEVEEDEMQIETEIKRADIKQKPAVRKNDMRPKTVAGEGAKGTMVVKEVEKVKEIEEIEMEDDDDDKKLIGKRIDER